jgi:hypothetical protein
VCEFIVGLQIVWAHINRLRNGIVAEVHSQSRGCWLGPQQERDRGRARCIAFQGGENSAAQRLGTMLVEQSQQLAGA